MARPYVFPDPNDRSPNEPSVIVSSTQVLGIYNQDSGDPNKMTRVTEKVQTWFREQAKNNCWDSTQFSGNQCVLAVELPIRQLPQCDDNE